MMCLLVVWDRTSPWVGTECLSGEDCYIHTVGTHLLGVARACVHEGCVGLTAYMEVTSFDL